MMMKVKKLWGAILSAIVFILYFGLLIFFFTMAEILTGDLPLPVFAIISFLLLIPLVGIVTALVLRVREIQGGEEEEAKKY
jgi:hypothetical protein